MEVAGDVADVASYWNHVLETRMGQNVYQNPGQYPYFPGWLALEVGTAAVAEALHVPFWRLIRSVVILADLGVSLAIWWSAARLGGRTSGQVAAAAYALNPICIIVSGFHGQFDALPTLFTVIAAGYLFPRPRAIVVGVLVGIALTLKPFPLLLLPVFLRAPGLSRLQQVQIAVVPFVVLTLGSLPYLLWDPVALIRDITGYVGVIDHGIGGLLRSLWLIRADNLSLPGTFGQEFQAHTRWLALAAILLTFVITARMSLPRQAAAIYLAFLTTYSGLSTQYLMWPVAWLTLSGLPILLVSLYGVGTAAGAIGFYSVYWPRMIGLPFNSVQPQHASAFVAGQVIEYITIIATFIGTLGRAATSRAAPPLLIMLASVVVLAAAFPVVTYLVQFAQEWIKFRR
jgi:uncharacterized membrane protein